MSKSGSGPGVEEAEGSFNEAPLANVIFTTVQYVAGSSLLLARYAVER